MPQAALPQTTLPKLDRMTMATLVAGTGDPTRAAPHMATPKAGASSGTMEFADYFATLTAFDDSEVQTSRHDVPPLPTLASKPEEKDKTPVSEMAPALDETSKPARSSAGVSGERSADQVEPFARAANAVGFYPSESSIQNPRTTDAIPVSVGLTNKIFENPKRFNPPDAVSDSHIHRSLTDDASPESMPLANSGTEVTPSQKRAVEDIFLVFHQQTAMIHPSAESGVSRDAEALYTDKAEAQEPPLSASVSRSPADKPFGEKPIFPRVRDVNPLLSEPYETAADSINTSPADRLVWQSPQLAPAPQGHVLRNDLDPSHTPRPAPETHQATVAKSPVEQTPEDRPKRPPDSVSIPPAVEPAQLLPVRLSAIASQPTVRDGPQPAIPWQEHALPPRFDQLHPEQSLPRSLPDAARATAITVLDHRTTTQPEDLVPLQLTPKSKPDDWAEERLRALPVHEGSAKGVSELKQASRTAAFAAPAFPAPPPNSGRTASEHVMSEHLPDIPLMADFSVTSGPVEDQQALTRAGLSSSSDPIRQVFQNLMLPSNRIKEGPVEIRLNPEELGQVRINISMAEGAIAMSIHAERSETLELLRRNIEQLSQEFRQIGYGNISFSFGQNTRQNDGRHKDVSGNRGIAGATTNSVQEHPIRPDMRGPGVDLRV